MAAGTDYPPPPSLVDGSYRKVNVNVTRKDKTETNNEPSIGKPPRHISAIRQSVSSLPLDHANEEVRKKRKKRNPRTENVAPVE